MTPQRPTTCTDRFWLRVRRLGDTAEYGPWTGKWLLHLPAATVDDRWPVIAGATLAGQLGVAAKVATALQTPPDGRYLVCVYTADCRDRSDVARVLAALRGPPFGYGGRLSYKEDGATWAQVYGRGAALYVAQPGSLEFERRREPIPVPPEHLDAAGAD
jgi:Domain of unknown function (DUF1917)